jgi:hypothetical protein
LTKINKKGLNKYRWLLGLQQRTVCLRSHLHGMAPKLLLRILIKRSKRVDLHFTMWWSSGSRIVALPELAQRGDNVWEYVLTFVVNTYPIFNPLLGGTLHLTTVMYLPQWGPKSTHLDLFSTSIYFLKNEHFACATNAYRIGNRMNIFVKCTRYSKYF